MNNQSDKLREISVGNLDWAKRWFACFWLSQVIAFGINAFSAFNAFPPVWGAIVGFGLAMLSELFRWRSDLYRATGERFKRLLEVLEGFGGCDFASEIRDECADKSDGFYDLEDKRLLEGAKYASAAPPGPRRALDNLEESAWFSKHMARKTAIWASVLMAVTVVAAIVALVSAIGVVDPNSATAKAAAAKGTGTASSAAFAAQVVGTVICGVLTFLVSINLFRYAIELHQFARAAGEAEGRAKQLKAIAQPDPIAARSALFDYQIARQAAPMIPTLVWRLNHEHLNKLRTETSGAAQP